MPKLSVIVPIYNSEKYLKECLDSLVNQTFKDIEIICVNDGSTDNSLEIVKHFAEKDSRIKVINQENKGQSAARNTGLKVANSNFITFIDSDDYIDLNTYEKVLNNNIDTDIICFGIKVFGNSHYQQRNSDDNYYKIKYIGKQKITQEIILNTDVSVCNKIFRKEIVDKYGINFTEELYYEDAEFFFKYISCCQNAYFINKYFYHYRRLENSVMSETFNGTNRAVDHLHIIKQVFDFWLKNKFIYKNINLYEKLFELYFNLAFNYSKYNDKDKILYFGTKYATEIKSKIKISTNLMKALIKSKYNDLYEPNLKFYQKIFRVQKVYLPISKCKSKYVYILGFKIKLKNKNQDLLLKLNYLESQINEIKDSIKLLTKGEKHE